MSVRTLRHYDAIGLLVPSWRNASGHRRYTGPDVRRLRRLAGPTVRFTGRVPDDEAALLLSSCRALVVTAAEEFGIAAVEAQAAGRPAIAPSRGGALETVRDGVTGRLWDGGVDALVAAIEGFDDTAVDPAACVANARRLDASVFRAAFPREVEQALARQSQEPAPHRGSRRARFAWSPVARR